jgi:hypothetical protein
MTTAPKAHLRGIPALAIFLLAGAALSFTSGIALLFPGSFLEAMWQLNPHAHAALTRIGEWAVVLMFSVSVACAAAAIGLWRGSWWGQRLAVGLIVVNLVGDVLSAFLGTEPRAILGVPIAAAILIYLLSKKVRLLFRRPSGT